jgi:hypothetical protein
MTITNNLNQPGDEPSTKQGSRKMNSQPMKKAILLVACALAAWAWTSDLSAQCPLRGGGGARMGRMSATRRAQLKAERDAKKAAREAVKNLRRKAKKTEITLDLKGKTVEEALDMIAKAGGITIEKIDLPEKELSLKLKDVSVLDAIKRLAYSKNLSYKITANGIVIKGRG